jgi:hypothetical protein
LNSDKLNILPNLKLFDSRVKPILLYCSEVLCQKPTESLIASTEQGIISNSPKTAKLDAFYLPLKYILQILLAPVLVEIKKCLDSTFALSFNNKID